MIFSFGFFGKRIFKNLIIISSVLGLLLMINPVVLAKYNPQPQNPPRGGGSPITRPAGSCDGSTGITLTLLAHFPFNYIGKTASTRPTFAWFVPNSENSIPLEFTIFELDSNGNIAKRIYRNINLSTTPNLSGIMTFTLPENEPELTVGKTYRWQVALICNPNSPSQDLVRRADLQVVEMPSNLTANNLLNLNDLERIDRYAEADLWYDALREALLLAEPSKLGTIGANLLQDLVTVEETQSTENLSLEQQQYLNQWIENTRQIITNYQ